MLLPELMPELVPKKNGIEDEAINAAVKIRRYSLLLGVAIL
jgi:hypothetical protein